MSMTNEEREVLMIKLAVAKEKDSISHIKQNSVISKGKIFTLTLDNITEHIPEVKPDMTKQEIVQLLCINANFQCLPISELWAYHAVSPLFDITEADYYNDVDSLDEMYLACAGDSNYKPIQVPADKAYTKIDRIEQSVNMFKQTSFNQIAIMNRIKEIIDSDGILECDSCHEQFDGRDICVTSMCKSCNDFFEINLNKNVFTPSNTGDDSNE